MQLGRDRTERQPRKVNRRWFYLTVKSIIRPLGAREAQGSPGSYHMVGFYFGIVSFNFEVSSGLQQSHKASPCEATSFQSVIIT